MQTDPLKQIAAEQAAKAYRWKRMLAAFGGEYLPPEPPSAPEPNVETPTPVEPPTPARIVSNDEIARHVGYPRFTEATRKFLRGLGVEPMKGRRDAWDIEAVNRALDRADGVEPPNPVDVDPVEEWFRDDDAQTSVH